MKWLLIICMIAAVCGVTIFGKNKVMSREFTSKKSQKEYTSFALLELFTSEGCSSCPPADKLLPQLANIDPNVIPLSFHVDYWNGPGWTDPFSNSDFSDRQRKYAEQFHLESIYTPQLIINGRYELTGSDKTTAENDIKKALEEKASVELQIDEVKKESYKLFFTCSVNGNFKDEDLFAAIVQNHAENFVKGGENRGAKLFHTNVIRSFVQKPAQQKMNFEIRFPSDLKDDKPVNGQSGWQLILFAQNKNDLKITGVQIYQPK
jgi:hypothetical protein